ncbi:sodium-dependent transporter [Natronomonas gomsonensis]|jgi:NSS family neurotransmitter:Na+ symporter|uniref:sodium-dependent transporter n=1 Tax=Natronomonas gomsonensis TaxID=1046043 RepID=UPI0020CA70D2|nr:sodium-dependent transporter [Natronomonas gomsonensis]MCY4730353.1 sodium-dependent transporter [Natronomonas gomsonensis]
MTDRETWATRIGFILASIGSAVGLGNIWRFPYQTAEFGGAAFLLVYLLAVVVIGLPAILAEFVVGRRADISAISAFDALDHPGWRVVGALGVFGGFWTLSYYSVVGGWVFRYIGASVTGSYLGAPGEYFGAVSAGPEALAFHAAFMLVTVGIVAFGIRGGIEKATKVMVPSIVVLLVGLAVYAFTLPGSGAGYQYFLSPDFDALFENYQTVVPAAVGQALFSLSLGFAVMITYASYIADDENLFVDGGAIALTNTLIGVTAGLVVFPLLAVQGGGYGEAGAGAIFVSIPTALSDVPFGSAVGFVFFLIVAVAALSSAISLLEVVVSHLVDTYGFERRRTTALLGGIVFALGVPSALDTAWLEWFDAIGVNLLLPTAVLLVVVFVGWVLADDAVDEIQKGADGFDTLGTVWLWSVRSIVFLAVLGTVALSLFELTGAPL